MSLLSYDEFKIKYNHRYLEYNNDPYKNQCMDEFYAYLKEVIGINPLPFQGWGSAKNCYLNFYNIAGAQDVFTRVSNSPSNVPQRGDIVFWGTYWGVTGLAGHVGIYDNGTVWAFTSFDQNYPTYSPCHLQPHSYKGVMGWLHRKTQ